MYDVIYESEVIENCVDVHPSLVADIKCPEDMDCKIQVNVYYESNRTNGTEILLCGATFSLRDYFRSQEAGRTFCESMTSEYCLAAKVYLETFNPFEKIFKLSALGVDAARSLTNPLVQKYVFYRPDDYVTPAFDVAEISVEPRLSFRLSELFVENIVSALDRSIDAWKCRRELERMRQGLFYDRKEALSRGWHELKVTVLAVKLTPGNIRLAEKARNANVALVALVPLTDADVSVPINAIDNTKGVQFAKPRLPGEKQRKIDEFLPCTCVRMSLLDM